MKVCVKAPLRLGLAGGGTDVSPYCDEYGGLVINATIGRYAYSTVEDASEFSFLSVDNSEEVNCKEFYDIEPTGKCMLLKASLISFYKRFEINKARKVKIVTFCDSPPGSGLGTSSTLVVALVKSLSEFFNISLTNYDLARISYEIERVECNLKGGRQDQYSAAFGGFNSLEFKGGNAFVSKLDLSRDMINNLESSLLLFFTGVSRDSEKIIANQSQNMIENKPQALSALHSLKNEAMLMREALMQNNLIEVMACLDRGWKFKKQSANVISNPLIEEIYATAINAGALAGKVSGAGGGGFMMFFTPIENRQKTIDALKIYDGLIYNAQFTEKGAHAWKIN